VAEQARIQAPLHSATALANALAEISSEPEGEIIAPASAAATAALRALADRFSRAVDHMRVAACELAYCGYRLQQAADWTSLGYRDEMDFASAHGLSDSTWRTYTKLGGRLQHLDLAEMQGLTLAAANQIVRVNCAIWDEYPWVEEAKLLNAREFAMLVADRNQKAAALPAALAAPQRAEPRIPLDVNIPASQQRVIKQQLETIRKREHLPTAADALTSALSAAEQFAELSVVATELTALPASSPHARTLLGQILSTLGGMPDAALQEKVPSAHALARD
jgi:hypothetical protein